jgi:hypothetical protein
MKTPNRRIGRNNSTTQTQIKQSWSGKYPISSTVEPNANSTQCRISVGELRGKTPKVGISEIVSNLKTEPGPKEFKVQSLRECPTPTEMQLCDEPEKAASYWRTHVVSHPYFNPDVESLFVLLLDIRRRIKGHILVSVGTLDTVLGHPREVFRAAVISAASAVLLIHNHPSGDPSPSDADIKFTRDIIRAGETLKISVLDHVIMGHPGLKEKGYASLAACGYFY